MLRRTGPAMAAAAARRVLVTGTNTTSRAMLGIGAVGGCTYYYFDSTERGRGIRREMWFWSRVAPVVFDYYWNLAESSPYVRYYQTWMIRLNAADDDHNDAAVDERRKRDHHEERMQKMRHKTLERLHEKHAAEIFRVFVELKGLYVKLGQVLSVTTLPVPNQYRDLFKTLQSDVPGWESFEDVVKPALERELGRPLEEVFDSIDPIPCGAASIGQAHKAVLRHHPSDDGQNCGGDRGEKVVVKVQYPDAAWQIPADIRCVGDLLKLCVFFGVVDESAANLSFNEFSRQFLSELDYEQERTNLEDIYQSSLDPEAPYRRRGVVVPAVYPDLCTSKVITMSYLPGPKLEEEARRQLEALGIDTRRGLRSMVEASTTANDITRTEDGTVKTAINRGTMEDNQTSITKPQRHTGSRRPLGQRVVQLVGDLIGVDFLMGAVRLARKLRLLCSAGTANLIDAVVSSAPVAGRWLVSDGARDWAQRHRQAERLAWTEEWIEALFDVHGHQIFQLGCFNADAHPGNILVLEDQERVAYGNDADHRVIPRLGLIDFGQCKRLTLQERAQIGRLLVSVAHQEADDQIADTFRELGVQTKNDSTKFLAELARLMFGPLQSRHLDHSWHRELHKQDSVTYFPNQLTMAYRTSLLLRGLAVSLQFNVSVGELWESHAKRAIERMEQHQKQQQAQLLTSLWTEDTPSVTTVREAQMEPQCSNLRRRCQTKISVKSTGSPETVPG